MYLRVALTSDALGDDDIDEAVNSFTAVDRIAARCARAIKQFIRATPVRASLHRTNFLVTAQWTETPDKHPDKSPELELEAPRPKRKRKVRK